MPTKHPKKKQTKKQWYTVVLLYPDWMTDDYGKDMYIAWAYAADVDTAVAIAQRRAEKTQHDAGPENAVDMDPADFAAVLVFEGKRKCVANALSFG